jgi:hypothetical protein
LKASPVLACVGVLGMAGLSMEFGARPDDQVAGEKVCSAPSAGASLAPTSDHSGLDGRYQLTVISEGPDLAGRRVAGVLWLWPSSAADSSPRTRKGVAPGDTIVHPYYGASDLDLWSLKRKGPSGEAELRSRIDPVYPEILVTVRGGPSQSNTVWKSITMWIGSVTNARDGSLGLDGAGFALHILEITSTGFKGRWGPAGIVQTEEGYFCAIRTPNAG